MKKKYSHVYGPVWSWRLGRSLGIDPVYTGKGKICSFDCIYCQAGRTRKLTTRRKIFIKTGDILKEINSLPALKIDYITFSGAGEPTLAENLGVLIKAVKKIRKEKIAVLTNSSLLASKNVRKGLFAADFVAVKLDAPTYRIFRRINRPARGVNLERILKGIREFRSCFKGKFALQLMFTSGNKKYAGEMAKLAREIKPDEVEINTPLRAGRVKPLSKKEIAKIAEFFEGMKILSVYEARRKKAHPFDKKAVLERRGKKACPPFSITIQIR